MPTTPDTRVLVALLGDAPTTAPADLADRLGISAEVAAQCLEALARDGLVEPAGDGAYRQPRLDSQELRELYHAVAILETLAVRTSPPFTPAALDDLRAINDRFRAAAGDPPAAVAADDDFHAQLVADCANPRLLEVLRGLKRELLRYERAYMDDAPRIARSAAQHGAILAALEAGDHRAAAARVRENFISGLAALTRQIDRG